MALKLEMQGQTYGPFVNEYTARDVMLFALGCGAGSDGKTDLDYVYEKQLKVLPIFAATQIVDAEVTKTIDYGFNWGGSLHWGFDLHIHQPLPINPGKLTTKVLLKGLFDRGEGRGCLAQHIGETFDEAGTKLFTNESWDCALYDGGFGGPKAPQDIVEIPDREPDFEIEQDIPLNQALIYRLSGDDHPQHVDWEYAQEFGHPKPNLHGVSTAGVACRHVIQAMFPGEPERLTRFKTRLTKSLYPGCRVKTQIWKWSDNCVHFRVADAKEPDTFYLNFGLVEWK
ncbi:MaoC/PaaZ C-terminal domain-containing protein [Shewanella fidelis]|uniref:MaoC/PaaZ C-terminal domain-containing protein n=1 Tax=Shewanella fidelis TaxID=173509 RepID=A0AAW8NR91_9GAMM|nr:MaoC/PaaZ C-terminal domain-containing protein [Shewanella fidelis]MDR8525632.1 MaoC/PaaZ C-terminal domain-containing protein [Shewanella fidelis]MDW4812858.1 MaoC/PaaZ C-terminal domain-containing protein [Shewanella fidelis]MDW4816606.1 MaoC/PaaZ C-terminal domain-containing protein [Shewanella fidelis]MDW4820230.1 MaoC/PaaZ C-terminal domain-containing protein [Shewanella fidelis]MDW4825323.1 MaoC/PaaZ C-terminal domain-containing protein [Shewanella fidelis]